MKPTNSADPVELTFVDGRRIAVHTRVADRVRGIDADGDLLVPLGEPDNPIHHDDGTEYLIALTPCCHASGKGSAMAEGGVVCRSCHDEVDSKYAGPGTLALAVTAVMAEPPSASG
ncbi:MULTISPECIES: hypothetical protein [Actinosynnema]|uniref:hypothetical protein n=1 Tax=Actinosynnema TaxID=40566 RepID=UPI0020A56989|nr:hypothetical protein [Actinosynnema pretiosum]MCP2097459.1 hypothetical protein [Actinosynnema pretiosum]